MGGPYQCLDLQCWRSSVKHKDRPNMVVQQFANAAEEHDQVCMVYWVAMAISYAFDCLVEPDTDI